MEWEFDFLKFMRIKILDQPDDNTCGPTSLHAVYNYMNYNVPLEEVVSGINYLKDGGTMAVSLGLDAIQRGFHASVYSYNLKIFDPSWFELGNDALIDKLRKQLTIKPGKKFAEATNAYIQFIEAGGNINFDNIDIHLLRSYFDRNLPVLAGLSATYLYHSKREYSYKNHSVYDDLKGEPMGHFVVLSDSVNKNRISVADPYKGNPISSDNYYEVESSRLINAIMLGIVTYDANLLIIYPKDKDNNQTIQQTK